MRSIARAGCHELEIRRSRFLCNLARVGDPDEAAAFIAAVRKEPWSPGTSAASNSGPAVWSGPTGEPSPKQ